MNKIQNKMALQDDFPEINNKKKHDKHTFHSINLKQ